MLPFTRSAAGEGCPQRLFCLSKRWFGSAGGFGCSVLAAGGPSSAPRPGARLTPRSLPAAASCERGHRRAPRGVSPALQASPGGCVAGGPPHVSPPSAPAAFPTRAAARQHRGGSAPSAGQHPARSPRCAPSAAPAHLHLHEGAAVEAAGGRGQGAPQAAPLRHGAARPAGAAPARAAPPLPPPPPPGFNFSRFPDYLIPCRLRGAGAVRRLRPGPPLGAAPAPGTREAAPRGEAGPRLCAPCGGTGNRLLRGEPTLPWHTGSRHP